MPLCQYILSSRNPVWTPIYATASRAAVAGSRSVSCSVAGVFKGAHRALWLRCAYAGRKVCYFPPPVATGPRVLNSAPYSPCCWYTRDMFFFV